MKTTIKGEVTEETILKQCISMSNDSVHAFFNYSPHLDEGNRVMVKVKVNDVNIYDSYDHYGESLAGMLQGLIALQYEIESKQEGMQNENKRSN